LAHQFGLEPRGPESRVWIISVGCAETQCGWGSVRMSGKNRWEGVKQTVELVQLLLALERERGLWFGYGPQPHRCSTISVNM
jgi:hypothetical protein